MQAPGPLKGGGVAPPANDSDLPSVNDKHKAEILHFMYFSEMAATDRKDIDANTMNTIGSCAHIIASFLVKKVHDLDIHPNSILDYYRQAKINAKSAEFEWNQDAVAEIMSNQLENYEEILDVATFVSNLHSLLSPSTSADSRVKSSFSGGRDWEFSPLERFLVDQAVKMMGGRAGFSRATSELLAYYWRRAAEAQNPRIRIVDPALKQSRNIEVSSAENFEILQDFELTYEFEGSICRVAD